MKTISVVLTCNGISSVFFGCLVAPWILMHLLGTHSNNIGIHGLKALKAWSLDMSPQ
jgi:hypothetical protein